MPDTSATITDPPRGWTVSALARRFRVGEEKVRRWILSGELEGLNVADTRCGKPRFTVTPEALERFERGRSAAAPPKVRKRTRRPAMRDFYPD